MAITIATDIVSDVLKAADPAVARAVAERLSRLQSAAVAEMDGDFGAIEAARGARARPGGTASLYPDVPLVREGGVLSRSVDEGGPTSTYRKFEAFVLQTFIESMLPQSDKSFGKGTAGVVWRSMLAEQLGTQLAKNGGVGLAGMLAKAHPPHTDANVKDAPQLGERRTRASER